MRHLRIHGAGATQSLVDAVNRAFYGDEHNVDAKFGPVGTIADAIRQQVATDIVVLTKSIVTQLAAEGLVVGSSIVPLGVVRAGVAVREIDEDPVIASSAALRETLVGANAIFLPDPVKSTSGSHFMRVLGALGITESIQPKLEIFSSGILAMNAMAATEQPGVSIGFTQASEIMATPGIRLAGFLPGEFNLTTDYVAAVSSASEDSSSAIAYLKFLSGIDSADIRQHAGFVLPG